MCLGSRSAPAASWRCDDWHLAFPGAWGLVGPYAAIEPAKCAGPWRFEKSSDHAQSAVEERTASVSDCLRRNIVHYYRLIFVGSRPLSAAKLHARRQKTGRGKSARFAPDDGSLTHTFVYPGVDEGAEVAIRQTPILDSKTFDDPDAGLALQVGWGQAGDSKGHRQNAQRAFWNAQRAENFMTSENVTALPVRIGTGAGGASERMEIKSGAGRLKSGSQGPKRPDSAISKRDKAILKRTASMMRSFRYDKWRLGVERKRSLAERSLSSVDRYPLSH